MLKYTFNYLDPCAAQLLQALAAHQRVGIAHGHHHALDARLEHRVNARARATLMTAGLKVQVESCAARFFARSFQSQHLGMLDASVSVEAFAHDVAGGVQDHGPDARIGRSQRCSLARQFNSPGHDALVVG